MGHAEMLLAVAGLKPEEVKALAKKLASGDWSSFPKAQRTAFGLAYKLSKEPAAITVPMPVLWSSLRMSPVMSMVPSARVAWMVASKIEPEQWQQPAVLED